MGSRLEDITDIRQKTPGCDEKIHFNNAGAALVSEETLRTQVDYLEQESLIGGYEVAAKYAQRIDQFYDNVAELINANRDEIAFTESATVAWLRVFWAINFQSGDEILCDSTSYASNYIAFLNAQKRFGIRIVLIDQKPTGELSLEDLTGKLSSKSKLISITHMPTNSGLVNPAQEVGKIAEKYNVLYQLDACQSVGQYPIDVRKIGCDFLSATGRKYLRGPRGTGFLFAKKIRFSELSPLNLDLHSAEWISKDTIDIREDARRFETWECNLAAKLGLSTAVSQAVNLGMETIWERVQLLADYLRKELSRIEEVIVTDIGEIKSGIVTFYSNTISTHQLKERFLEHNINTVVAIKSGTRVDMENRSLDSILRASVHYYNTKEEIDKFINLLTQFVKP